MKLFNKIALTNPLISSPELCSSFITKHLLTYVQQNISVAELFFKQKTHNDNPFQIFYGMLTFIILDIYQKYVSLPNCFFHLVTFLTLFRMRGKKDRPTSFSPATSTNVGISPLNFLTFSFKSFSTLLQNLNFIPYFRAELLGLNQ